MRMSNRSKCKKEYIRVGYAIFVARTALANRLVKFFLEHPSGLLSRLELQILLLATAYACDRRGRCILFCRNPLAEYAAFTKVCIKEKGDRRRLYQISCQLGRRIRRFTGLTRNEDLSRLIFMLYKNIGIDMSGQIPGELQVSRCAFSAFYTADECAYISAMDAGMIAGICGRGRLHFTQRITEGCKECRACFSTGKE